MNLELQPYHLLRTLGIEIQNLDTYIGREFTTPSVRKELRKFRAKLSELEKFGKSEVRLLTISIAHRKHIEICRKEYKKVIKGSPFLERHEFHNLFNNLLAIRYSSETYDPIFLTPREKDVLRLIAKGLSNEAICETLCIKLTTVKTHLTSLYRKLGVNSRSKAILKARTLGLLSNNL